MCVIVIVPCANWKVWVSRTVNNSLCVIATVVCANGTRFVCRAGSVWAVVSPPVLSLPAEDWGHVSHHSSLSLLCHQSREYHSVDVKHYCSLSLDQSLISKILFIKKVISIPIIKSLYLIGLFQKLNGILHKLTSDMSMQDNTTAVRRVSCCILHHYSWISRILVQACISRFGS